MMIFALRAFETRNYETHTIFYASNLEMARKLTLEFVKDAIEYLHLEERYDKAVALVDDATAVYRKSIEHKAKNGLQLSSMIEKFNSKEETKYPELAEYCNHKFSGYEVDAFGIDKDVPVEKQVEELIAHFLHHIELDRMCLDSYTDGD